MTQLTASKGKPPPLVPRICAASHLYCHPASLGHLLLQEAGLARKAQRPLALKTQYWVHYDMFCDPSCRPKHTGDCCR